MTRNLDPKDLRKSVLRMARAGNSVHVACAFSLIEVVSVLYSKFVTHPQSELSNPIRDHVILSKGHGVMAMYAAFAKMGWLDQSHLDNYFSDGSMLHGLSEAKTPGLEVSSGSLGHGLPIATGMALGLKRQNTGKHVYCIVGDGELNEGSMWEAILFAGHHKLDNLTIIVDANGFQAMGSCTSVAELEPMPAKFESFGFHAIDCDGHDLA
ncbi:MAG: thiamine pyrophosphate-dependent enzyme, partial [Bdellovibrionota bacterium]